MTDGRCVATCTRTGTRAWPDSSTGAPPARPQTGGRVDPRVISLIENELAQLSTSTGTKWPRHHNVTLEARDGLPLPSRATLYRTVANLERGPPPVRGRHHPPQRSRTDPTARSAVASPTRPGELMEIDSTPLDLMVVYPDGTTGRPDLTVLFDLATRTISATMLRAVATKSVDVAAFLLAKALTPLPMQPGWDASMTFSRSILPPGILLDDKDLADRDRRPPDHPARVHHHRPREACTSDARSWPRANGCKSPSIKSAPRTPTDKPHIERLFSAINTLFVQHLAGYTGRSTTRAARTRNRRRVDPRRSAEPPRPVGRRRMAEPPPSRATPPRHAAQGPDPERDVLRAGRRRSPVHVTFEAADYLELLPVT